MDIISNRIIFLNIHKDDEFFITLSKKYKGRFYKKLKNSFGWSFPLEFKEQIETEYKNINKTQQISDSSETDSSDTDSNSNELFDENLNTDNSESSSESSSSVKNNQSELIDENDSDSSSINNDIVYLDKSTQTDDAIIYKYDIPSIIDENLKIYKNLI